MKRELRKELTIKAEAHAIDVFATNLRSLLMTPPLKKRGIIGLDPGYRTGCKVAVIDAYGKSHPRRSLSKQMMKLKLQTLFSYRKVKHLRG